MLAIGIVIVYVVGGMYVLSLYTGRGVDTKPKRRSEQPTIANNQDIDSEGITTRSRIEGPIETYQDNTYIPENLDVCMTQIPNGIDIQGTLTDLPGFGFEM